MITLTIDRCLICKSQNSIKTDFNLGQVVCTNCGVVLDDRIIDETSEWRNFSNDNPGNSSADPNRVGGPINPYLDDGNLSTMIYTSNKNGPLSKWKNRSLGGGGRSFYRKFKRVEELCSKLDLPTSIIDKTKDLLHELEKNQKLKGRNLDGIIASVIFQACRRCSAPRTLKEIVHTLQLDRKIVARCFNSIKTVIVDVTHPDEILINTLGLVHNYCNKLQLPINIKTASADIAEEVCKKEIIAGRNPATVATASIYYALGLFNYSHITKKDIALISKTTENTIYTAYQVILSNKDSIKPKNLTINL